jgi:hypothetical protein
VVFSNFVPLNSQPQSSAFRGPAFFTHQSTLSKKYLEAPIMDLAFLILPLISVPSLRGVMVDPRYLKLATKFILFPSGRSISLGKVFWQIYSFTSLRG